MDPYVYPYSDFTRDFDALLPSPNAAPKSFGADMAIVRDYMRATYPDPTDRKEREVALGMIQSYLVRNMAQFDTGRLGVRGESRNMISEELLRATHALVCPFVFGQVEDAPRPSEVIVLAERFAREE